MADAYFDFHWPLSIINLIKRILFGPGGTTQPINAASREWLSQPRPSGDTTTEVITTRFKLPLSVSEIGWEALRVPSHWEVWYQDRSNNWLQMRDYSRVPVVVDLSGSAIASWYKFNTLVYPIVAKAVQFRCRRRPDVELADQPYPVGMKNALIKRNVYDRSQGVQYLEDEQDPLGNVISKYIRDWDAPLAVDDNSSTFWKSAPMPDPAAVVSLYLDLRGNNGTPRLVDKLYLDPVYSGQHLNLYYSNDDTIGVLKPSPITVPPLEDENTSWRASKGRSDEVTGPAESFYRFKAAFGPLSEKDVWIGVEWTPAFDYDTGPSQNPTLFSSIVTEPSAAPSQWKPTLLYDVGAGAFTLKFDNGIDVREFQAPLDGPFSSGEQFRIVAGWGYQPTRSLLIKVIDRNGRERANFHGDPVPTLPGMVTFDGVIEIANFRGLLTNTILKMESYLKADQFLQNPTSYTSPEPVIPDPDGVIPSTTLDYSLYAAPWVYQEHGTGGLHESSFEEKEWTPVWKNYVAEKGMLFLPQTLSMKYLKLEFTNLTESPYPIYESGIDVKYKVFPISVQQQSNVGPNLYSTAAGGFLGLGNFISVNGVRSVNWLNPMSVLEAVNSTFGRTVDPVMIQTGPGFVSDTIPNIANQEIRDSYRLEAGSSYVYRRQMLDPYILSQTETETIIKAEGLQKLSPYTDIPWKEIEAANPGAIQKKTSYGALPVQGADWWIFPGQTLRIPAPLMEKLTDTSTVINRKLTLEHRVRFTTTSVHRYEIRTLRRDAAIAYFAGVREVQPLVSSYVVEQDRDVYDFTAYDPTQWVMNNIEQMPDGPVSTTFEEYRINNGDFKNGLANWIVSPPDSWVYDPKMGNAPRGSAKAVANGTEKILLSSQNQVSEGNSIHFSTSVKWKDLAADPDDLVIQFGLNTYLEGEVVDDSIELYGVPFSDPSSDWTKLVGEWTVPAGVDNVRTRLTITDQATSGTVWVDSVEILDLPPIGTLFKSFTTTSTFGKVKVDFRDSGLVRSNSLWADENPDSEAIQDTLLAYYVKTIPENLQGATWSDWKATWSDEEEPWGSGIPVVQVFLDPDRYFEGHRVVHFRRAPGSGEAGIKARQWTYFVPSCLARVGCVFYKPFANGNEITLRLRRMSDGVYIYEETIPAPVGRWVDFQTRFFEIPGTDLVEGGADGYEVSITLSGDDEDELYLSNLYTEIAHIRYFIRLGGVSEPLIEVTDLRYLGPTIVTHSVPVNEMSIQAAIYSGKSWAYGCSAVPIYLK
jgi:hypothetical protein